jgi:hypothetical protein
MRYLRRHKRALLIALLLCVTGVAQFAALASETESHHASDHCCLRCHVGPLPFLKATGSSTIAPVFEVIWLAPNAEVAAVHDIHFPASPARAPPAA